MRNRTRLSGLLLAFLLLAPAASAVSIDWVTVGDPSNACDPQSAGCFGAVPYVYRISKFEVTNTEYAEFLNAVAATDTNALYDPSMENSFLGGIVRNGVSGSFTYSAIAGREELPANFVSFWDALRFANWLDNGQPTGDQDDTTTEDGAYTITAQGISDNSITRNAWATITVTNEDEWYKAAYYDAISTSFFDYPAGTDTQIICAAPGATLNTANCGVVNDGPTDVGSYTGAASPSGTFDQGGNVFEWNEAIITVADSTTGLPARGLRGGGYAADPIFLAGSDWFDFIPGADAANVGFRVVNLPEPDKGLLLMTGVLGLAYLRWRARASTRWHW